MSAVQTFRRQVYRHLLFNRLGREDARLDVRPASPVTSLSTKLQQPSIIRLGTLLLLFDVYLTWARIENATSSPNGLAHSSSPHIPPPSFATSANQTWNATATTTGIPDAITPSDSDITLLSTQPILLQYVFFLLLCFFETLAFHLPIRALLSLPLHLPFSYLVPYYPHPHLISTAIIVSSFTKLFPLLLLVWNYDLPSSASAVSWAVIINNVAALEILLDCGYIRAVVLAAFGAVCRAGVGWGILRAVGVGGGVAAAGVVETGDLIELWKELMESAGFG
ncbi:hypothetical protein LTR66_013385 [Elasticomyces elasticus]|nr:hypothetical protein LTR66_013385 [Elasticomyces elasticus]